VSAKPQARPEPVEARAIVLGGRVQGVGYRPFVVRTARDLGLAGTVHNGAGRVRIHAEGRPELLDALTRALVDDAPPLARPRLERSDPAPLLGLARFDIVASDAEGTPEIHIPPDLFTCDDCLQELSDPAERRHAYPFINCTQCGPRYTLITAMPYDRPNTSMADFPLCPACRAEYGDVMDRRFHAQPLACPACGPRLRYAAGDGAAEQDEALERVVTDLEAGRVVAVKGVGGYHLVCDAASNRAVRRLRRRKQRPDKPLAVMFPLRGSDGLDAVRRALQPGPAECEALLDPARPIVLVRRRPDAGLSPDLAPGLNEIGAFLPYSPLHHLLLRRFGRPVVATSGNVSGEPVITGEVKAAERLADIADAFLHHDRPIVRPADDPVVAVIRDRPRPLRLGRGTAPVEVDLPFELERPLLATGGHMKNTVALGWGRRAVVSPHIGELDSPRSREVFAQVIADLQALYGVEGEAVATDTHPGYAGTRWAEASGLPVRRVQHHAAHASALAAEHPDVERWLIFAWDGVGLGDDGTLWGGEALHGAPGRWRRVASFRPFALGGGDRAGRQPWRSAAGLLWTMGRDWLPSAAGAALARDAWSRGINTHRTSAVGRLFDAAACLLLGRETASFEGQGPMALEAAASRCTGGVSLPLSRDGDGVWRSDWAPLVADLEDESRSIAERAGRFHATLADSLLAQALRAREEQGVDAIGLTGGVFQNRLLCDLACARLAAKDFDTRLPTRLPANDGGLAFGQVVEAGARERRS
jgi:hydrogenase maturation protein HypF